MDFGPLYDHALSAACMKTMELSQEVRHHITLDMSDQILSYVDMSNYEGGGGGFSSYRMPIQGLSFSDIYLTQAQYFWGKIKCSWC